MIAREAAFDRQHGTRARGSSRLASQRFLDAAWCFERRARRARARKQNGAGAAAEVAGNNQHGTSARERGAGTGAGE
jgi:hypothetical protein